MIRTQHIKLLTSFDGRPNQWHEYYVHRDHAYGGNLHVAHSKALVCPSCCEIWCYLRFVDETDCWADSQYCTLCNKKDEWHPVPGSILSEEGYGVIDDSLLRSLPAELVKREFKLHIEAYQK